MQAPAVLQAELAARFPWVVQGAAHPAPETVSTGVPEIDALTGGLGRGSLVELCGERCSGRTSVLAAMLAAAIRRGEVCALVDAADNFDPRSAQAAGVDLARLLWARCTRFEEALRAAEWLLLGGGFGLVALDLGEIPPAKVRRVPLNVWFRFRRAVEHTPTVLVILEQQPHSGPCASLVLELRAENSGWPAAANCESPPHAKLFTEKQISSEVTRCRGNKTTKGLFQRGQNAAIHRCFIQLQCQGAALK